MSKRKYIPSKVETRVLVQSARRCCLCYGLDNDLSEKKGQIAHLDHDPSNASLGNLAFLCFRHHDLYDSTPSQSKGLQVAEVKHYRAALYKTLEQLRISTSEKFAAVGHTDGDELHILFRISSGKELVETTGNAHFYKFDYDEPATEKERALVSSFLNNIVDYCSDLESAGAGAAVNLAFWFTSRIEDLEQRGFKVFGKREQQRMEVGSINDNWDIAVITIIRADNPMIFELDEMRKLGQVKDEDDTGSRP